jgi:RHS repeat-associated protein
MTPRQWVPTVVTDTNDVATYLTYDQFGRKLSEIRPGDSVAYPTLRYAYNDTTSAFSWVPVANPEFEIPGGWAAGWNQSGEPWLTYDCGQAHTGVCSLKAVNATELVGQKFVPGWQPGQTYEISAWVKTTSTGTFTLAFWALALGEVQAPTVTATGTWQRVTLSITIPAGGVINEGIVMFRSTGTVLVDDIYVRAQPLKVETWQREVSGCSPCVLPVFTFYDGVGRQIQTRVETLSAAQQAVVNTLYDAQGRVVASFQPAFESFSWNFSRPTGWSTRPKTTTTYDALGRTLTVTGPDGAVTQSAYGLDLTAQYGITQTTGLLLQSVTDANGHFRQQISDRFGRLVTVREFTGSAPGNYALYATTSYGYDTLDHLVAVTDTLGVTTTIQYNDLGQKTGMHDPDMGDWEYAYDPAGNLQWQMDARDQVLWFFYDDGNRMTEKRLNNASGTLLARYFYDTAPFGEGRPAETADTYSRLTWVYDARGRVLTETRTITGTGTYVTGFAYDAMDRVITTTYPTGEQVINTYNDAGQLSQVRGQNGAVTYASGLNYNALGQPTTVLLGNGVQTTNNYHSQNGRLLGTVSADIPAPPALSLAYQYDLAGNVTRITDTTRSEVNNYQYDSLDRLTWITVTTGANLVYQQLYRYGPTGNITSVGSGAPESTHTGTGGFAGNMGPLGNGRGGFTGLSGGSASSVFVQGGAVLSVDPAMYFYTDTAHVHAVTTVTGLGTFAYDNNGNMTRRVERGTAYTQTFDAENRLVSVAVSGGGTTQYQYDAGGQLIKKIAPDGTVTVYLGLVEYEIAGGVTQTTSYYTVPGARVVRVGNTLSYVLTDHLGSSSVTLDDGGGVVGELRYYAYGETRVSSGTTPTERLYSGQLQDDDIGLYYYNARWYSAYLNRFVSADTLVPVPGSPQSLNRYAYANNSPTNFRDPTGHVPCAHCSDRYDDDPGFLDKLLGMAAMTAAKAAAAYAKAAWAVDDWLYENVPSAVGFQITGGAGIATGAGPSAAAGKTILFNWRSMEVDSFVTAEASGNLGLTAGGSLEAKAGPVFVYGASTNSSWEGNYVSGSVEVLTSQGGFFAGQSIGLVADPVRTAISSGDPMSALSVDPASGKHVVTNFAGLGATTPPGSAVASVAVGTTIDSLQKQYFDLNLPFSPIPPRWR